MRGCPRLLSAPCSIRAGRAPASPPTSQILPWLWKALTASAPALQCSFPALSPKRRLPAIREAAAVCWDTNPKPTPISPAHSQGSQAKTQTQCSQPMAAGAPPGHSTSCGQQKWSHSHQARGGRRNQHPLPVLDTPATLLGSLMRSCMTARTRNSYQVS